MNPHVVGDANLLIALLDDHNAKFEQSLAIIRQLEPGASIWIHPINLAEVLAYYDSAVQRRQTWVVLRQLASFEVADLNLTPLDQAMRVADQRHAARVSMPDVCALTVAIAKNATLITFDRQLAAAARRLGVEVIPG